MNLSNRKSVAKFSLRDGESFFIYAGTPRQVQVDVETVLGIGQCKLVIEKIAMTETFKVQGQDPIEILPDIIVKGNPKAVTKFDGRVYLEVYVPMGVKVGKERQTSESTNDLPDSSNPTTL